VDPMSIGRTKGVSARESLTPDPLVAERRVNAVLDTSRPEGYPPGRPTWPNCARWPKARHPVEEKTRQTVDLPCAHVTALARDTSGHRGHWIVAKSVHKQTLLIGR